MATPLSDLPLNRELLAFLLSVPDDFLGSVTVHYDGHGPASWERKEGGRFPRPVPPVQRRRVVTIVQDRTE